MLRPFRLGTLLLGVDSNHFFNLLFFQKPSAVSPFVLLFVFLLKRFGSLARMEMEGSPRFCFAFPLATAVCVVFSLS